MKNPDLELAIQKLDRINYLPVLMPIIINNRDFIGLTQKQVDELDAWRKTNQSLMLAAMKAIVSKRIAIKQAALSPTVSSSRIILNKSVEPTANDQCTESTRLSRTFLNLPYG